MNELMNGISIWDIKKEGGNMDLFIYTWKIGICRVGFTKRGGDQKYWDNWDNWVKGNRRIE